MYNAQLEILSYQKVKQVLREDIYNVEPRAQPDRRNQSGYHDEHLRSYNSKYYWTLVTSTLNRKTKVSKNYLIQLIPPTHNKYDVLFNLKEDSETPNHALKKEET